MPVNPNLPIFLLVFGLLGVFILLGGAAWYWRATQEERDKKHYQERVEDLQATTGGLAALVKTPGAAPRTTAPSTNEVLRVLRDPFTGRLIIEMAGRRYHSLAEVDNPTLRDALVTTLLDLQVFVQNAPAPSTPASVPDWLPPAPAAPAAPAKPVTPPPTAKTPPLVASSPTAIAPEAGVAPASSSASIQAPSMNPFKQMQTLRELAKKPAPVFKSIPEQIDEVLQTKVVGTPFATRGLRIGTNPKGAVQFEIDGTPYAGVDDLPDRAAATLVRAAIAEWEKR